MRRQRLIGAVVMAATLASAAPAAAGPIDDYRRTGRINPCNYSDEQLRNGLNGLPPDVQQYAPGLADQLSGGREGCGGTGAPGSTGDTRDLQAVPLPGGGAAAPPPEPKVPRPPAVKPAVKVKLGNVASPQIAAPPSTPDVPGWILPLLVILGTGGVLLGIARARAGVSGDGLGAALRASSEDASERSADAFAGLVDRLRFR